jgi:hypothetical protein
MSMTENKAVETLEYIKTFDGMDFGATKIALETAIQALEEIQAYRAIGTVEELQRQKDYIDTISEVCSGYSEIGTIEKFKALKEKNEPKKVVINNIPKTSWTKATTKYTCPSCDRVIGFNGLNYCSVCGQKLDWQ